MVSESSRGSTSGKGGSRKGNRLPVWGNFEGLHRPHAGKEVAGVGAVGLGGMVLQVNLPFLLCKGLVGLIWLLHVL